MLARSTEARGSRWLALRDTLPWPARYGSAVVLAGLALALKLLLDPLLRNESPFLLFFTAIVLGALVGGLGAGLVATALSALASDFFLLTPYHSLWIDDPGRLLALGIFVAEGVLICAIVEAMYSARRRAEAALDSQKENQVALRFLAEASEALSSSLDYHATLASVARLSVPRLADWCAVDMIEEDGSLERLAVIHEDPEKIALALEMQERYPPDPDAPYGLPQVLRTGEPELVPEITEALIEESVSDEEQRVLVRELGLASYMVVPLVARETPLGAITFVYAESDRHYEQSDLELAVDLARRAALAVDNARLYREAQQEISGRKRIEEELRKSGEQLQSVLDNSPAVVFIKDLESRYRLVNRRFEELFHVSREQVVGLSDHDIFTGEIADQLCANDREVLRRGVSLDLEEVVPQDDGMHTYASIKFPLRGPGGEPYAICGISTDITERKRAEEALRQSEERYRVVTETASDAIVMIDEKNRVLFTNSAVENVFGYTSEELIGQQLTMLMPPRLRSVHEASVKRYLQTGRRRLNWRSVQITGLHKSGEEIPLEISFGEFVREDKRFFTGFIRDVTERKRAEEALQQSEERYRAVVEQITEGIYLLDGASRRVLETNPALRRMLGYTEEEMRGMEVYDLLAHDREDVDANLARTLSEGHRFVGERRYLRKDGSVVEVEVGVSTILYEGREVVCVTVHDITDRKRTEQALQDIREAERNRIARDLHDGVLQDLSYTAQALQVARVKSEGTHLESELEEQIETILRSARGLREAIYDLRLQSYRDQNFEGLLESLLELSRRRAPDIRVEVEVQDGFSDLLARSGGMELLRIVQEALTNVRRHSGAGVVRIKLGYSEREIWTEVSDDGWGLDTDSPPGTGIIGMRERAFGLGGRLEITSETGSGTTVRFEAPLSNLSD
ncbi:MAG TPA: PAS domain S-box protein [Rubrobacteraceae bacterium]|nr:PAS domain S-box protein [Rubrobacteraceae bacterium]